MKKKYFLKIIYLLVMFLLFNNSTCTVEYSTDIDWIFINETDYDIYYPIEFSDFNVAAHDTLYYPDAIGVKIEKVDEGVNEPDYLSGDFIVIKYGLCIKCDTILFLNEETQIRKGPMLIENYEGKKYSENNYEFTYRYTEEDFQRARECE